MEPLNATEALHGNSVPKPGDVCFCLNCGSLAVLNEDMQLRKPTKKELAEFNADPAFHEVQKEVLEEIKSRRQH